MFKKGTDVLLILVCLMISSIASAQIYNDWGSFRPLATAKISASTTTANAAIAVPSAPVVRLFNDSSATAWIVFCPTSSCTATNAGMPLAAGASISITQPIGTTYVAVLLASSTGTLYLTSGSGKQ